MKYCKNCGNSLDDMAVICPKCGVQQEALNPKEENTGDVLWAVLAFISPAIGLILFAVWRKSKPKRAKLMGIVSLVAIILVILMSVIQTTP